MPSCWKKRRSSVSNNASMSKRGYCCKEIARRSSLSDCKMAINFGAKRNSSMALTLIRSSMTASLSFSKRRRKTRCASGVSGKGNARRNKTMVLSSILKSPGAAIIVVWRYSLSSRSCLICSMLSWSLTRTLSIRLYTSAGKRQICPSILLRICQSK